VKEAACDSALTLIVVDAVFISAAKPLTGQGRVHQVLGSTVGELMRRIGPSARGRFSSAEAAGCCTAAARRCLCSEAASRRVLTARDVVRSMARTL